MYCSKDLVWFHIVEHRRTCKALTGTGRREHVSTSRGDRDSRWSALDGSGVGSDAGSFTRKYIVGILKCFKDIEPGRAEAPS